MQKGEKLLNRHTQNIFYQALVGIVHPRITKILTAGQVFRHFCGSCAVHINTVDYVLDHPR